MKLVWILRGSLWYLIDEARQDHGGVVGHVTATPAPDGRFEGRMMKNLEFRAGYTIDPIKEWIEENYKEWQAAEVEKLLGGEDEREPSPT